MMGWHGGGFAAWGWMVMSLSMLLVWALLFYLGYLLGRAERRSTRGVPDDGRSPALHVLDDRLARGDIEPDEYSRRSAALRL
jgi:putative membrane protein